MKKSLLFLTMGIVLIAIPYLDLENFGTVNKLKITDQKKQELRVMSYNIHHANPPSKKDTIDLEAVIRTIRDVDPDLVALQEIDADTQRSGKGNQAQLIADALSMHVFFGKAINFENGAYGVALLSKFPITESKVHKLRSSPETNGEPRILATVKVEVNDGRKIRFGSTHLDSQKADTNRLLQIDDIAKIAQKENLPFLIAGDFNAVEGNPVIDRLDQVFKRSCASCAPTIPVNSPKKAIDFVAFRPKNVFTLIDHQVIDETYASDHLPVLAILNL